MCKPDENEKSRAKPIEASPTSNSDPNLTQPDPKNLKAQMEALADIAMIAHEKGWCNVSCPMVFEDEELYEDTLSEETREHLNDLLSRDD